MCMKNTLKISSSLFATKITQTTSTRRIADFAVAGLCFGFFDDEVHALLGLDAGSGPAWQVLYHFTAGQALDDERLASEPAYAHIEARRQAQGDTS